METKEQSLSRIKKNNYDCNDELYCQKHCFFRKTRMETTCKLGDAIVKKYNDGRADMEHDFYMTSKKIIIDTMLKEIKLEKLKEILQ